MCRVNETVAKNRFFDAFLAHKLLLINGGAKDATSNYSALDKFSLLDSRWTFMNVESKLRSKLAIPNYPVGKQVAISN